MASDIKWIKIVTDLFDDEKIQLIEALPESDTVITIWFKLLCLAGKCNNSGLLTIMDKIPYTENMLAHIFRRKESSVHQALEIFVSFGMIEVIDGVYVIHNWEKHQEIDKLEQIREKTRNRVAEYRERQKLALEDKTSKIKQETKKCNVTVTENVTQCNALESSYSLSNSYISDKDIIKERIVKGNHKEKNNDKSHPKDIDEVYQYFQTLTSNNPKEESEAFYDYYESNGWKIGGKTPMKDWKAACRNWNRNSNSSYKSKNKYSRGDQSRFTDTSLYSDVDENGNYTGGF